MCDGTVIAPVSGNERIGFGREMQDFGNELFPLDGKFTV